MLVMCDEIALRLVCRNVDPLLPSGRGCIRVKPLVPHHAESVDGFRRSKHIAAEFVERFRCIPSYDSDLHSKLKRVGELEVIMKDLRPRRQTE
jgi:hypothetical protein